VLGQHRRYIDGVAPTAVCNPANSYWAGQLDGFRVWQRTLSDADIASLQASSRPPYP
jgi:hypothetical protein